MQDLDSTHNQLGALEALYLARAEAQEMLDRCDRFMAACQTREPADPADLTRAVTLRAESLAILRDAREPMELTTIDGQPCLGLVCGIG